MKLLYLGDIVGKTGREAVCRLLPALRRDLGTDFVIINGENAAHGFGITIKICEALFAAGADVVITGNHAWDQREIIDFIDTEPRLLRPLNLPPSTPGRGFGVFAAGNGRRVAVIQAQGRLFMPPLDDPFRMIDTLLDDCCLGDGIDAIFVDMHAEATSEKMALGQFLDGRVSVVVGSHTHIPTADAQILPRGTAYQTDIGMCGDYDSVIGMEKQTAIERLTQTLPTERLEPAAGEATVCGLLVETDDATGLAVSVSPLRLGGRLLQAYPSLAS